MQVGSRFIVCGSGIGIGITIEQGDEKVVLPAAKLDGPRRAKGPSRRLLIRPLGLRVLRHAEGCGLGNGPLLLCLAI